LLILLLKFAPQPLEKPYHDWTSHAADEYRMAAVIEDEMTNVAPPIAQAYTGAVKPFYPNIGV
jgi:hypothetical protein